MEKEKENDELCPSCNKNPKESKHQCPYQYDINNDPDFECECCEECENQCLQDI